MKEIYQRREKQQKYCYWCCFGDDTGILLWLCDIALNTAQLSCIFTINGLLMFGHLSVNFDVDGTQTC